MGREVGGKGEESIASSVFILVSDTPYYYEHGVDVHLSELHSSQEKGQTIATRHFGHRNSVMSRYSACYRGFMDVPASGTQNVCDMNKKENEKLANKFDRRFRRSVSSVPERDEASS